MAEAEQTASAIASQQASDDVEVEGGSQSKQESRAVIDVEEGNSDMTCGVGLGITEETEEGSLAGCVEGE